MCQIGTHTDICTSWALLHFKQSSHFNECCSIPNTSRWPHNGAMSWPQSLDNNNSVDKTDSESTHYFGGWQDTIQVRQHKANDDTNSRIRHGQAHPPGGCKGVYEVTGGGATSWTWPCLSPGHLHSLTPTAYITDNFLQLPCQYFDW